MKRFFYALAGIFLFIYGLSAPLAFAAPQTFIVTPFLVEGPQGFTYLKQSIPTMLNSRLFWEGKLQLADTGSQPMPQDISNSSAAEQYRKEIKADYIVWGDVKIQGQDSLLTIHVQDKNGKKWDFSDSSKTNQLMAALKVTTDKINTDVFKRPIIQKELDNRPKAKGPRVNQMNPNIVINETTPKEVYLNPQFRYAGNSEDDDRTTSQRLPFAGIGMEVCDADGDGTNEIFLLEDHKLYAYTFSQGKLEQHATFPLPSTHQAVSVRSLANPNGTHTLFVNTVDKDLLPVAYVLRYTKGQLSQDGPTLRFFVNVVGLPPSFKPVLVGQQGQPSRLFRGNVYTLEKSGNTYVKGRELKLPSGANALNFTYLPGGFGESAGDKLIVLDSSEHLRTYTAQGTRLAQSEDTYSGSAKGFEINLAMPGLGKDRVGQSDIYYVPMRMIPSDLDHNGVYELLVNKPISTAATIFDRYRLYPQSEIQSLYWDGLGLALQWKTRRIKGSVADFMLADVNNDGILDLVLYVNTHPGALGTAGRKSLIQFYPLDLSQNNPNTIPDKSFIE